MLVTARNRLLLLILLWIIFVYSIYFANGPELRNDVVLRRKDTSLSNTVSTVYKNNKYSCSILDTITKRLELFKIPWTVLDFFNTTRSRHTPYEVFLNNTCPDQVEIYVNRTQQRYINVIIPYANRRYFYTVVKVIIH
jgi:hypothetical protein